MAVAAGVALVVDGGKGNVGRGCGCGGGVGSEGSGKDGHKGGGRGVFIFD